MINKPSQQKTPSGGFVLLLTLVVISVILAVGLSLLHITMKQTTLANIARESEIAFHAASTGAECMQFHRAQPRTRADLLNIENPGGGSSGEPPQTIEAEDCTYDGTASVETGSGSSGSYVDYGSWLECSVSGIDSSANVNVTYANGSSYDRPVNVELNSVNEGRLDMAFTGGWGNWGTETIRLNLTGNDTLRFPAITSAGPNIDYITVFPVSATTYNAGDTSAPPLNCAGSNPVSASTNHTIDTDNNEYIYNYIYRHNVDSDKCVETSLYMVDASEASDDMYAVIDEGIPSIECEVGSVCTTIFARGFNRSCDSLTSQFTVQRELTIEY